MLSSADARKASPGRSAMPHAEMETFIVRIYRRKARADDEPAGTIEHVGTGDRVGFASARELLDRLLAPRAFRESRVPSHRSKER
jgi:hypothetical protein